MKATNCLGTSENARLILVIVDQLDVVIVVVDGYFELHQYMCARCVILFVYIYTYYNNNNNIIL